jgi:predicted DNA binding CopG/RHH family protein
MSEEKRYITIKVKETTHKKLKAISVMKGQKFQDFINELLSEWTEVSSNWTKIMKEFRGG